MNCFQDNAPRRWAWRAEKSPMKTSRRVLCTIPVSDRNMPGKRTIVSRNYRQVGRLFRGNEYPAFVIIESVYRHSGFLLSSYQTFSIENSNSSHFFTTIANSIIEIYNFVSLLFLYNFILSYLFIFSCYNCYQKCVTGYISIKFGMYI